MRKRIPHGRSRDPSIARTSPRVLSTAVREAYRRVFLGLGSNLGDRWAELERAVAAIPDVVAVSPIYETEPLGGPAAQYAYLNCVVEMRTSLPATTLLDLAGRLETTARRVRTEPNGPRTLDVDILLVGDEVINGPRLVVPHPRMWERRFVVQPLFDLAPELLPDGWDARAVGAVNRYGVLARRQHPVP